MTKPKQTNRKASTLHTLQLADVRGGFTADIYKDWVKPESPTKLGMNKADLIETY